jgi:integrase
MEPLLLKSYCMARNLISGDAAIRDVKPGDPRKRLGDGDGLYLLLFVKGGSHGWRLDYSVDGRRKTLSLGTYPDTGLAQARKQALEAREQVAMGRDPSAVRQQAKKEAEDRRAVQKLVDQGLPTPDSFEAVARDWVERIHKAKVSVGHASRTLVRFEQDVFPYVGRRPLNAIEAPELLQCLRRVIDRGAIETAHRAKDACGQVFRYGIASGLCQRNPAADLRDALPPVPSRHLAAIVEPKRAAQLLCAMQEYAGNPITRAALQLSALLFLRPGELRQLEWAWVNLNDRLITMPAAIMKRRIAEKTHGAPHLVPLAPQAMAILRDLRDLTGAGRYLFPSLLTSDRPMSDNTVRSALRRMGYGNEDMTAHGFRAMARTMADERLGVPPEVIEAQLAHAVPDALGRAYNRTQFLAQRRDLMEQWANYLDWLRTRDREPI